MKFYSKNIFRSSSLLSYQSKKYASTEPTILNQLKKGTGGRSSFNGQVVTVFGASSLLGRHLVSILGKMGCQIIIPYRGDPYFIRDYKVMGDLGQILFLPFHLDDTDSIKKAMRHSNIAINLIGKQSKTRNFTINQTNIDGAARIARAAKEMDLEKFIHVSSMSQNLNPQAYVTKPSQFMISKAKGEIEVMREFPETTIVRPADMWGYKDRFLAYYALPPRRVGLVLKNSIPLWKMGTETIKQPVNVQDVAQGIANLLKNDDFNGKIIEAVGPHRYRLDDLVKWILFNCYYMPEQIVVTPIYNPILLARVALNEVTAQLHPFMTFERLEQEFYTDKLEGNPTLEDIGVKLTKLEDRIHHILHIFSKKRTYWEAVGEFPPPPNPPISPI